MNSRPNIVDHYLELSTEPGFEIDQVRKELEANQVPEEEIKVIVRLVDNALQERALAKVGNNHAREIIVVGLILTIVGLGITVGTFQGWIPSGNSVVIVYGPFFGGLAVALTGLAMRGRGGKAEERIISRNIKRPF